MLFAGHTMGVPELDLIESIRFFGEAGFDGIEIRCNPDAQLDLSEGPVRFNRPSERFHARIRSALNEYGLAVACLSTYYGNFTDRSLAAHHSRGLRRAIDVAVSISCKHLRVIGGAYPTFWDGKTLGEAESITVEHFQELGKYAADRDVFLLLETHSGTMVETAIKARRLLDLVNSPYVGVIYDQNQIDKCGGEEPETAVRLLAGSIRHVHLCPHLFEQKGEAARVVTVLRELNRAGYEGYVSVEYPRCWDDSLPPAEVSMVRDLATLRRTIEMLNE